MRVIAGTARSLKLKTINGLATRPTTDKIKETLFNMLQQEIYGCQFLDLFAGSGAIGIEALSRGAARAVFVEEARRAVACIRENLAFTRLAARAEVICARAHSAPDLLAGQGCFDLVYMDPPYGKMLEREVLEKLRDSDIISQDTKIILEAPGDLDCSWMGELGYEAVKRKQYRNKQHIFLKQMA